MDGQENDIVPNNSFFLSGFAREREIEQFRVASELSSLSYCSPRQISHWIDKKQLEHPHQKTTKG